MNRAMGCQRESFGGLLRRCLCVVAFGIGFLLTTEFAVADVLWIRGREETRIRARGGVETCGC